MWEFLSPGTCHAAQFSGTMHIPAIRFHRLWAVLAAALIFTARAEATVTMTYATVGNAGNAADTGGLGSVSYVFSLSAYDVTNTQYAEFLNAVDPSGANTLSLWNSTAASDNSTYPNYGIDFSAGAGTGSHFTVRSQYANLPVVDVTFGDAIRFANWMNNGQGSAGTETGSYTISSGNVAAATRNAGAGIVIPSLNEWYKAAYYDPLKGGTGGYWLYPTMSSTPPQSAAPNSVNSDSANFFDSTTGYAIAGPPNLTPVGAYTLASSYYGTFDQGGDAYQWNDTGGSSRGLRGGSWNTVVNKLASNAGLSQSVSFSADDVGFRVAKLTVQAPVPEPGEYLAWFAAASVFLMPCLRRRLRLL